MAMTAENYGRDTSTGRSSLSEPSSIVCPEGEVALSQPRAAALARELSSLTAAINGYADLLNAHLIHDDIGRCHLSGIRQLADRAMVVVDHVFELANSEPADPEATGVAHDPGQRPPVLHLQRTPSRLGCDLTSRELEVLEMLACGVSGRVMAETLFLSVNTIRNRVQAILNKLGAHSRLEAVAVAVQEGIIVRP